MKELCESTENTQQGKRRPLQFGSIAGLHCPSSNVVVGFAQFATEFVTTSKIAVTSYTCQAQG